MQMLYALGGVDDQLTLHAIDPTVWRDRPDPWMARLCYALALLVEPLRNPAALLGSRLIQLTEGAGPRDLAALATPDEVTDLIAMRDLARETLLPALAGQPGESGPTFAGSEDLHAYADLIVDGLLLDIKAGQGGSPRKDGTRTMSLSRPDLDQLLGYALLDYPDEYALHSVGYYLARYGTLITWPLVDLCAELAGHPIALPDAHAAFRQVLREELPAYWTRIGRHEASPSSPATGAIQFDLPPKPTRKHSSAI